MHTDDDIPPAPCRAAATAEEEMPTAALREMLLDEEAAIFARYRAMFTLRNRGGVSSVEVLGEALSEQSSPLLRHEVAFVLGQLQVISCRSQLQFCYIYAVYIRIAACGGAAFIDGHFAAHGGTCHRAT
eukprot:SAG11_NODE_2029_length_3902_cov_2.613463_4_plen_129_part_00